MQTRNTCLPAAWIVRAGYFLLLLIFSLRGKGERLPAGDTDQYRIRVGNEYRCTADSFAIVRTLTHDKVDIPNAFSPNGDGHNDVFYVMGNADVLTLKDLAVYNRWGQQVFHKTDVAPNDPRSGWDGYIHGERPVQGTYVYTVQVLFSDGLQEVFRGYWSWCFNRSDFLS